MIRMRLVPGMLALIALSAACADSPTVGIPGTGALTRAEAEELAADWEYLAVEEMGGFALPSFSASGEGGASMAVITTTVSMTRTRPCPAGGRVTMQASATHTFDREARTGSFQGTATRTDEDCAFSRNGSTLTIDGNPNVQMTASAGFTAGQPGKRTATSKGSFTWARSGGASGTCAVDLTGEFDPATRTQTVKGTFCGQTIDVTRTRRAGA